MSQKQLMKRKGIKVLQSNGFGVRNGIFIGCTDHTGSAFSGTHLKKTDAIELAYRILNHYKKPAPGRISLA